MDLGIMLTSCKGKGEALGRRKRGETRKKNKKNTIILSWEAGTLVEFGNNAILFRGCFGFSTLLLFASSFGVHLAA